MRFLVFIYRGNFHTSLFQTEHNGLSSLGWRTVQCDGLPFLHHLSTTSPQQASCKIIHFYVARKISCQQHLRNSYTYLQNLTLASAKYFISTLLILKMKWFSIPELKYFISICWTIRFDISLSHPSWAKLHDQASSRGSRTQQVRRETATHPRFGNAEVAVAVRNNEDTMLPVPKIPQHFRQMAELHEVSRSNPAQQTVLKWIELTQSKIFHLYLRGEFFSNLSFTETLHKSLQHQVFF